MYVYFLVIMYYCLFSLRQKNLLFIRQIWSDTMALKLYIIYDL